MDRRSFLKKTAAGVLGMNLAHTGYLYAEDRIPDAVWVENGEPADLLQTALDQYGGMQRFVSPGDVVVIKPNIGWDRAPQFAANTNPDLVRALVRSCYQAGADKVKLFDRTCNNPRRCYRNSQIEAYAEEAEADVSHIRDNKFTDVEIKNGELIDTWPIYEDYLEADKVINVPIAKHHSLSRVTLGLKNLMGVMGGNRGSIHSGFDTKLIDIVSAILPTLTIIDAYRVLMDNGPVGGNLADVRLARTLIMSPCMVTADFLGLRLFDYSIQEVGHIQSAVSRGLNHFDVTALNLKQVSVS